jgi:hypothetical protein
MTHPLSDWRIIGASVTGTSHGKTGQPCQDAHAYRRLPAGVAVLVTADGAGSAERSAQGAAAAVDTAANALAEALSQGWPAAEPAWQSLFDSVYAQARAAVIYMAEAQGLPPRAFASTLLCAAASDRGLAVAQLGDGLAVATLDGGDWYLAATPQRGEYANETYFLTQADSLPPVDVRVYADPVHAVAVMTDGLLRLVLDLNRNQPHRPFFQPLLAFAAQVSDAREGEAQLTAFLDSDRVCARTDDDKTLVLAARQTAL